jgi:hypothetical protein
MRWPGPDTLEREGGSVAVTWSLEREVEVAGSRHWRREVGGGPCTYALKLEGGGGGLVPTDPPRSYGVVGKWRRW